MFSSRSFRMALFGLATVLTSVFCSSSYITPMSLTQTASSAQSYQTAASTAFFMFPSSTPTSQVTSTPTSDPGLEFPTPAQLPTSTPEITDPEAPALLYTVQSGDSLQSLAARFAVEPSEIVADGALPESGFLNPGQILSIPQRFVNTTPDEKILPDSEVIFSATAIDFDVISYVEEQGGKLSDYREYLSTGWATGGEIVERVATDNSINPLLLLSLLEYQSHWVSGQPTNAVEQEYPMGRVDLLRKSLYRQLVWAVNELSTGYYGWREGSLTELQLRDGNVVRLAPTLNAGSVALQYFFSRVQSRERWEASVDPEEGLAATHTKMFGDPWIRAEEVEPLFPGGLSQPSLILPFRLGETWALTGGPHGAWSTLGSMAALDFAPDLEGGGCAISEQWVVASAPGKIARAGNGVVVLDPDGDGYEQTGWAILYLHVRTEGETQVGESVDRGDFLGYPSCLGGSASGTHVHIARKYNGEWIAADGTLPFVLSGWEAHAGEESYQGSLTRGEETIPACQCATLETNIARSEDDPE